MRKVSIIGLGYVGLPLAVAFGEIHNTIGYDIDENRIRDLKKGFDSTGEIFKGELLKSDITFTNNIEDIVKADFHIITVPTPIGPNNNPDLSLVIEATKAVAKHIKLGDMVVYESTVYPGVTEDICIPILEEYSGLKSGLDFKVGYSPERVSPGSAFSLKKIKKLVSGQDDIALEIACGIYKRILGDLVVPVSSIRVAEASKVLENVQRDVNIALINQVGVLFKEMGIDTGEVLAAAKTKWNFGDYTQGLVGGHCVGVDPYYLIHSAENLGIDLTIVKEAREVNESMVAYVVGNCKNLISKKRKNKEDSVITVLGLTFKENCSDKRNSKALQVYHEILADGYNVNCFDPVLNFGTIPHDINGDYLKSDLIIVAVAHDQIKDKSLINKFIKEDTIIMDIKGIFSKEDFSDGVYYWKM